MPFGSSSITKVKHLPSLVYTTNVFKNQLSISVVYHRARDKNYNSVISSNDPGRLKA
ncbi:hypothetical protein Hdeb2414_s0016g00471881 [Helianthus debilis subsp. tardiflorus]